jgi:hypothetical protein
MFHELLVAWRGFPVEEVTWEPYYVMAVDVPDIVAKGHGVSRGHRHGAQDAISLRVLMGKCYALLRIRPLSISCAEDFVVISCGKVDNDKYGWRDD